MADRDDAVPSVENLANEMGRATRRLRAKAWMINAMSPGAAASQQPETTEAETATGD